MILYIFQFYNYHFFKRLSLLAHLISVPQKSLSEIWSVPQQAGFIYNSEVDIAGRFSLEESVPVYCSEVRNTVTEWRCFVSYGEILDIRRYKVNLEGFIP